MSHFFHKPYHRHHNPYHLHFFSFPVLFVTLFFLTFPFLFCGCSSGQNLSGQKTSSGSATPIALPTEKPTDTPVTAAASFNTLLDDVFSEYATTDSLSLHYTIHKPETFQIARPDATLGSFGEAEFLLTNARAAEHLARLQSIPGDALDASDRFLYDLLHYALKNSIPPDDTILYDSPLGPTTGLQTQLPVLLAEYRFSSPADVEEYFLLLSDLPRYFSEICTFEKARSAAGTQSCKEVLSRILLQCEAFVENPGDNFLITSFRDRLSVLPDMDATEIAALCMKNQNLVFTKVIPAYEQLIETLTGLTDSSVPPHGLSAFPNGTAYYEHLVRSLTGSDKSIKELESLLENALFENMLTVVTLYESEDIRNELSAYSEKGLSLRSASFVTDSDNKKEAALPLSVSALSSDLLYGLKKEITNDFPEPPKVSCRVQTIHPSLEDFISPALYLVPPFDNYTENVIYINRAKCTNESLFSTLAHEGYPGHLYQNTYFAATSPHPIRMLLNFTGYDEGWGTYAELYSYHYADCSEELRRFLIAEQIAGLCLYSLSDIRIHYYDEDIQKITAFLRDYGLSPESAEELYYTQLAEPAVYLPYSVGYLELCSLRDDYRSLKGADAPLLPFHTFLLKTGPAPFSILREQLQKEFCGSTD